MIEKPSFSKWSSAIICYCENANLKFWFWSQSPLIYIRLYWFIQLGSSGDVTKGPNKGLKNISKFLNKFIFFLFASKMLKLYSLFKCYTISETTWHIFYTDEGINGILPLTNEKWHIVNDFFIQNFLVHRGFTKMSSWNKTKVDSKTKTVEWVL